MSFGAAVRREFIERMTAWAQRNRPAVWGAAAGDSFAAWGAIARTEGAVVLAEDRPPNGGKLALVVGSELIIGVEWAFGEGGKLESFEWSGFDPHAAAKEGGRLFGGRRYGPEEGHH